MSGDAMGRTWILPRLELPWPAAAVFWLIVLGVGGYIVAFPLSMFAEDTYFYFQIAANFVAGQGVTFHGYTPTNGFHPLWFLVVSALQAVAQDRILLPYLVMAAVVALTVCAFYLLVAAGRRLDLSYRYVGLAVLTPYCLFTQIGSESALVVPLVLCAVWALSAFAAAGRARDFALLHLALALLILARLDSVFVAALLGLASAGLALRRRGLAGAVKMALLPGAVHVLLLGGYLLWNLQTMGHLLPISGALKGSGDAIHHFSSGKIADIGWASFACILASTAALAAAGTARQRLVLLPLYGGVALHAVYIGFFTSGLTDWAWYYGAWVAAAALALAQLATTAARLAPSLLGARAWSAWGRRTLTAACAALVLLLPAAWLAAQMPRVVAARDAGWARLYVASFERNLPKNQGVFVFDYPGALAYLGGYRVLPADGLVNDYAYQDDIRSRGILAYLRDKRIFYVMAPGPDLDVAARDKYCGVLIHSATRLSCAPAPGGGAEAVGLTVYAALNGQDVGVIPLPRDRLAFTVPSLGFGVWRIDPGPEPGSGPTPGPGP